MTFSVRLSLLSSIPRALVVLLAIAGAAGCGEDSTSPPAQVARATLHGIGGFNEWTLYAVGDGGRILSNSGNGLDWQWVPSPTRKTLFDVVVFSATEGVAVGQDGTCLRFDGLAFNVEIVPTRSTLRSVWASSADNIIAVGDNGVILQHDGFAWQSVISPSLESLHGVWALKTGEAYAVGTRGEVLRRFAGAWNREPAFTSVTLRAVWADKPDDWFAVGDGGEIWQNRGTGWKQMSSTRSGDLYDVFGSDSAYVFVSGAVDSVLFYDQTGWQPIAPTPAARLEAIWAIVCALPNSTGRSAGSPMHCSNSYFAGTEGTVARYTLLGTWEILAGP